MKKNTLKDSKFKTIKKRNKRDRIPLSKELVEREMVIAQGTIECVHYSIKHGISMNIAGEPIMHFTIVRSILHVK